jgi:hypothetical protein
LNNIILNFFLFDPGKDIVYLEKLHIPDYPFEPGCLGEGDLLHCESEDKLPHGVDHVSLGPHGVLGGGALKNIRLSSCISVFNYVIKEYFEFVPGYAGQLSVDEISVSKMY